LAYVKGVGAAVRHMRWANRPESAMAVAWKRPRESVFNGLAD